MSLKAFTNLVGDRYMSDWRVEQRTGIRWSMDTSSWESFSESDAAYAINVEHSWKPPTIHGDRKTDYGYGRGINKVVFDNPAVIRSHWFNPIDGHTSSYDYNTERYLSRVHTPFSYNPCYNIYSDNVWSESVTKALNSLSSAKSELGSALGEARSTLGQAADLFKRVGSVLLAIKRGKPSEIIHKLGYSRAAFTHNRGRTIANDWLAYVYGWRPLATEVYNTQKVCHEIMSRQDLLVEGHGKSFYKSDYSWPYGNTIQSGSWKCGVKTVLKGRIANPTIAMLNDFGLVNPLSIAWELVPFSFVIDWFLPIGNTLSAMSAAFGLDFIGGYTTRYCSYEHGIRMETGRVNDYDDVVDGGSYLEQGFDFHRTAYSNFPKAEFYADLTPYSTPRAVNALALLRQLAR